MDHEEGLKAALADRYAIEHEIGSGGMATVYLAQDLKHDRKVAVKVLRPELAAVLGAERFLSEIQTTAHLQHPNILPLFDSGEADGLVFYVMPYVEGESLRERLNREKQLPVEDAVRIAIEVGEALQAAHDDGVVHRDIKPANILLRKGKPLVADFGIALALRAAGGDRLTETGMSLGTPHYMSPEQATGEQTVGSATDVYALGCVLYEMLLGDPPYSGSTAQAILGRIITGELPSVIEQRSSVPANVDGAVTKALEKIPADRFSSARDFAAALVDPSFRHGSATDRRSQAPVGYWKLLSGGLAAALLAVAGVSAWSLTRPVSPEPVWRQRLPRLADNHRSLGDFEFGPAGTGFIYHTGVERWYRRWDELTGRPLEGSDGFQMVSPEGDYAVTASGDEIRVIPLDRGPIRRLSVVVQSSVYWGGDGYLYFSGPDSTIHRVPELLDGEVERLGIEREEGEALHQHFSVLPGGETAVFSVLTNSGDSRLEGYDFRTGRRTLLAEGFQPCYTRTGHLVFGTPAGEIMAASLDPRTLEMGPAISLVQGVQLESNGRSLSWSLSSDGILGYWEAVSGSHEMVWVNRSGAATPVDPDWIFDPGSSNLGWALSPDNSRIALRLLAENNFDIWVKDLPSGSLQRLTLAEEEDWYPGWLSDSTVTFVSSMRTGSGGPLEVFSIAANGTGEPQLLFEPPEDIRITRAVPSPGGEWLLLRTRAFLTGANAAPGARDILAKRLGTDEELRPLLTNPDYAEHGPALSPDGRWLAYFSGESGRDEVSVRPFPDVSAGRILISTQGGISPVWSRDGTELFYVTPDRRMMAARVSTDSSFRVISRDALFEIGPEYVGNSSTPFADVADDGRFLMMRRSSRVPQLVIVHNWFRELEEQVVR